MIEINLLPEEFRKKEGVRFALPEKINRQAVVLFTMTVVGAQLLFLAFIFYQKIELAKIKVQVEKLRNENQEITARKAQIAATNSLLGEVHSIMERKFYWSSLLNALSDSVTKGVWLRGFSISGEESKTVIVPKTDSKSSKGRKVAPVPVEKDYVMKIEGSVIGNGGQEQADIGKFIKELQDNATMNSLFGEIKLFDSTQRKIKTFDVYDFTLTGMFKKEKF